MKIHVIASLLLVTLGSSTVSASTIRTASAVYGDLATQRVCDATPAVASLCDGRPQCLVPVASAALCGDPAFLTVKQVRIDYRCGRQLRRVVADEYRSLEIECR